MSHARNVGLQHATGEWISFVDADDVIIPDYLECLYSQISDSIDIVMGNFYFDYGKDVVLQGQCSRKCIRKSDFPSFPIALMVEDYASVDNIHISVEILCAACNKLTRKRLIDTFHIRFAEDLCLNEDGLFHLTCYLYANDIVITDRPLYHYYIRETSSNNRYRPDVHQQMIVWCHHFKNIASQIPLLNQSVFLSLSAYRAYLNLMALFVTHPKNNVNLIGKFFLLKKMLNTGIYDIQSIPPQIKWFKKIELFALKYHMCIILMLISYLRKSKKQ